MPDVARFDCRDCGRFPQVSLPLLALARQDVAFESLIALDLAGAGHAETLGCSSVGFYFWHFFSPVV
jgi:hypothetical protein